MEVAKKLVVSSHRGRITMVRGTRSVAQSTRADLWNAGVIGGKRQTLLQNIVPMCHNQGYGRVEMGKIAQHTATGVMSVICKKGESDEWLRRHEVISSLPLRFA